MKLTNALLIAFFTATASINASSAPESSDIKKDPSKLQLRLNLKSIKDIETKKLANQAAKDIEETIKTLTDSRFDRIDIENRLFWIEKEKILIPPENTGALQYKKLPGQKRWSFNLKRADNWSSAGENLLFVRITYTDVGIHGNDLKEDQVYEKTNEKWRLIKQTRVKD